MAAKARGGWWQAQMRRVTQRPMGRLETALYEWYGADAARQVVGPEVLARLARLPDAPSAGAPPNHPSGGLVVDVGCGGGGITQDLAAHLGVLVVGVEPSPFERRRFTRGVLSGPESVALVGGLAGALPVGTGQAAAVVSSCSFKHWPDLGSAVAECARVLAPGGLLVLVDIDEGAEPGDLRRFAERTRLPRWMHRTYAAVSRHSFTGVTPDAAALTQAMVAAGLREVETDRIEGLPFVVAVGRTP